MVSIYMVAKTYKKDSRVNLGNILCPRFCSYKGTDADLH